MFCYEIVFALVCINSKNYFTFSLVCLKGHAYKLYTVQYKPRCVNTTRGNFFFEIVVNVWNSVPCTVNFSSLTSFRPSIERVFVYLFEMCVTRDILSAQMWLLIV